jgi:hypothetical protein
MSQQSCIDTIPPLLLSDTFNTWFNRTNSLIEVSNNIVFRGLDLVNINESEPSPIQGLRLTDVGSCFFHLEFVPGPFIGYITGGDTGTYGDGSAENPYKATLVFPDDQIFTMDDEDLTGDDYFIVKDTSDLETPIKQISSQGVKTKVFGGNKIAISPTGPNGFTISWVDLNFIPTFSVSSGTSNRFIGIGTYRNNQTETFTIGFSSSSDVGVQSSLITFGATMGSQTFTPISFDGTGEATSPPLTIPAADNTFGYGSGKSRSIRFDASITSKNISLDGIPFVPETKLLSQTVNFGHRFGGTASPNVDLSISNIFPTSSPNSSSINAVQLISNSSTIVNTVQTNVTSRNTTANDLKINKPSGIDTYYFYFIYSDEPQSTNSKYGWVPSLFQNAIKQDNAWTDLGWTGPFTGGGLSGESFRVLRFNTPLVVEQFNFAIGGNATTL